MNVKEILKKYTHETGGYVSYVRLNITESGNISFTEKQLQILLTSEDAIVTSCDYKPFVVLNRKQKSKYQYDTTINTPHFYFSESRYFERELVGYMYSIMPSEKAKKFLIKKLEKYLTNTINLNQNFLPYLKNYKNER